MTADELIISGNLLVCGVEKAHGSQRNSTGFN